MAETERSASKTSFLPLAIVIDERLSKERALWLTRVVSGLRAFTPVSLIRSDTDDAQLRALLDAQSTIKLLLPWDRFAKTAWLDLPNRVGGYSCDFITQSELEDELSKSSTKLHTNASFWDFSPVNGAPIAATLSMKTWLQPESHCGVRSWIAGTQPIYVEHWSNAQGLGHRLDQVAAIPELKLPQWEQRRGLIRTILTALWSLVYEHGSGVAQTSFRGANGAIASLQITTGETAIAFRLCTQRPGRNPNEALKGFLPGSSSCTHPAQVLHHAADLTRVQWIKDAEGVEITAVLFAAAPLATLQEQSRARAFWIGSTTSESVLENPFEIPSPSNPQLRVLPSPPSSSSGPKPTPLNQRSLEALQAQVRALTKQLAEKEEAISELRAGGVGKATPLPPPDTEALIEAFQQRYFESKLLIRKLESDLALHQTKGGSPQEALQIQSRMDALANRERTWIKKLSAAIGAVRAAKAGGGRK